MFTCPTCGKDWPENYCPICARTITRPEAQRATPNARQIPVALEKQSKQTAIEALPELKACFWWFLGLIILNIALFWWPFLLCSSPESETNFLDDVVMWGIPFVAALAIYPINKLLRIANFDEVSARFPAIAVCVFFILIPFTAPLALLLLCNKTFTEAKKKGVRIFFVPPWLQEVWSTAIMFLIGCLIIYYQIDGFLDYERLKKSGQPVTGTLEMVTKNYAVVFPAGHSFTISYAGTRKDFDVDGELYKENTLPDGTFTPHDISLIYLPSQPRVSELAKTMDDSPFSLFIFLMGVSCVWLGGLTFYDSIAGKSWIPLKKYLSRKAVDS